MRQKSNKNGLNMKEWAMAILVVLFIMPVSIIKSYATIPYMIGFQGRLTDTNGNPITGSKQFIFRICDALTAGNIKWSETQAVQVINGVYNVQIGSVTNGGIPAGTFEVTESRWLEINIENENLVPRSQLISQPYAYVSERAYGVIGTTITSANIVNNAITPIQVSTNSYEHIRAGTATVAISASSVSAAGVTSGTLGYNVIASSIANKSVPPEKFASFTHVVAMVPIVTFTTSTTLTTYQEISGTNILFVYLFNDLNSSFPISQGATRSYKLYVIDTDNAISGGTGQYYELRESDGSTVITTWTKEAVWADSNYRKITLSPSFTTSYTGHVRIFWKTGIAPKTWLWQLGIVVIDTY